jgi:FimV-like protein
MSEQLKHIFDSSACLSKRQLKDYVTGIMSHEESYALEHHVNTCFFCSEALDGMLEHSEALVTVDQLNTGFLKDHFSLTNPQIHLNSLAPAAAAAPVQKRVRTRSKTQPLLLKPTSIAAAIILGFGVMWYLEFGRDQIKPRQIASGTVATTSDGKMASNEAEVADAAPVTEQSATAAASGQMGVMSSPDGGNQMNDQPQKVQPLIITDSKTGAENKSAEAAQKDITAPSATVATNKAAFTKQHDASGTITLPTSKVEKLPTRNTSDITTIAAGAPAKDGESSVFTSARKKGADDEADDRTEVLDSRSDEGDGRKLSTANALYESGNYGAAASSYKEQIGGDDKRTSQQATLMAARSYLKLGQKEKAKQLLQSLVNEGSGSQKRQAKRMLKDLEE